MKCVFKIGVYTWRRLGQCSHYINLTHNKKTNTWRLWFTVNSSFHKYYLYTSWRSNRLPKISGCNNLVVKYINRSILPSVSLSFPLSLTHFLSLSYNLISQQNLCNNTHMKAEFLIEQYVAHSCLLCPVLNGRVSCSSQSSWVMSVTAWYSTSQRQREGSNTNNKLRCCILTCKKSLG